MAARPSIIPTGADPQGANPPQGGAAIKCPDQDSPGEDMVTALLADYAATGSSLVMADAYEYTFGYVMGYEEGLSAQSGIAEGALLSVPTKAQQDFAHVDCGVAGSEMACVSDPTTVTQYIYDWDEYYFWKFMDDLATPGTPAAVAAAAGYAKACGGSTCSPATLSTIAPSRMSVVQTGLNVNSTSAPGSYIDQPECWINNTTAANDYGLRLYSTSMVYTTQTIPGTGVVLGWQTQTGSGKQCAAGTYDLSVAGIQNGGQFLEIETDAAAESACDPDLSTTLGDLVNGAGNTTTTCFQ